MYHGEFNQDIAPRMDALQEEVRANLEQTTRIKNNQQEIVQKMYQVGDQLRY